jgi:hypothetical protein
MVATPPAVRFDRSVPMMVESHCNLVHGCKALLIFDSP